MPSDLKVHIYRSLSLYFHQRSVINGLHPSFKLLLSCGCSWLLYLEAGLTPLDYNPLESGTSVVIIMCRPHKGAGSKARNFVANVSL